MCGDNQMQVSLLIFDLLWIYTILRVGSSGEPSCGIPAHWMTQGIVVSTMWSSHDFHSTQSMSTHTTAQIPQQPDGINISEQEISPSHFRLLCQSVENHFESKINVANTLTNVPLAINL